MLHQKLVKTIVYVLSGITAIYAGFVYWNLFTTGGSFQNDIGETTGTILAFLMGFEMLIFFAIQALKRNLVPLSLKKYFVTITKYFSQYHYCVGSLGISMLILHFGQTLDFFNPWQIELVTGYITTTLIILSVLTGILYNFKIKILRKVHVTIAFMGMVTFLFHIF